MGAERLSTGKAARLCSVNPDTVLKWIRKGRLVATRTPGGHYRINEDDLVELIPALSRDETREIEAPASARQHLHCWEYMSRPGAVPEDCGECIVYQTRAAWCFKFANLGQDVGHRKSFCTAGSCEECSYYRRATGQATNVLVVTSDREFTDALSTQDHTLALRFARNAYEASAVIGAFRPAFVVVDRELTAGSQPDLLACLAADTRVPGLRIIVAVEKGSPRMVTLPESGIVGVIAKPFGQARIAEIVDRFPVELLPSR